MDGVVIDSDDEADNKENTHHNGEEDFEFSGTPEKKYDGQKYDAPTTASKKRRRDNAELKPLTTHNTKVSKPRFTV
jgi:hypothetical protein